MGQKVNKETNENCPKNFKTMGIDEKTYVSQHIINDVIIYSHLQDELHLFFEPLNFLPSRFYD